MDAALERIPALEHIGIRKFYNGPESFTPDNQFLLGEAPGLAGYFVGAGFNSVGIASAGGAGRALAEWIVDGEPSMDLVGVDVRRFAPYAADETWLRSRVAEILGLHYAIPWPNREPETARDVRLSPLHERAIAAGATFGTRNGWERPLYFGPPLDYRWDRPQWLEHSAAEQVACRTAVAVFDQTSFSKYAVSGPDALRTLQWVCANDVDVAIGQAVYTPWLNARGTYESDVTVTRTADDEFLVVSSAATTVRDLAWLDEHVEDGAVVHVDDLSGDFAVLGVMGPRSRELLARLTGASLDDEAFPFATSRPVDVAGGRVRATRMTYVGELGWELLVPNDRAVAVYDALHEHGAELGLADAGYSAIESLRLEKGFRAFGRELTPDYSPVEAGLVFATALSGDKDFLGRRALVERRERLRAPGPRRRLVSFVVADPDAMLWGGELVLRHGEAVGQVTSAAYGATVGASVGLAYLRRDEAVTVRLAGRGRLRGRPGGPAPSRSPRPSRRRSVDPRVAQRRRTWSAGVQLADHVLDVGLLDRQVGHVVRRRDGGDDGCGARVARERQPLPGTLDPPRRRARDGDRRRLVHQVDHQRASGAAVAVEVAERAVEDRGAVVDHDDPVAQGLDVLEVVRGEHERGVPGRVERAQELAQPALADHVEADGRLVEEQDLRVVQQRGHDVPAHPLAEAELADRGVEEVAEVEELDVLGEVGAVPRGVGAVDLLQHRERVAQRQVPPQRGALAEDDAEPARQLGALPAGVEPGDPQPAAGRHQDAGEHLDGGGLARTVGADVADHLAGVDGEGQVVHGEYLVAPASEPAGLAPYDERTAQVLDLDQCG